MTVPSSRRKSILLAGRLMVGALAGKILGFVREIEMARLLGAGATADAFRAGITATLTPVAALQGDIVPSTLIPLHRDWSADGTAPLRFALLCIIFGILTLPILVVVWLLADSWVGFLTAGFGPEAHATTVQFVRAMALVMPATVLASCLSCVEISVGRSRIAMLRASVQNLAVIGAIALMAAGGSRLLLGWAFSLSMTLTALVGLVLLIREGELTLRGATLAEAVFVGRTVFRRVRPMLVLPVAEQGNIVLERILASTAGLGALASLDYARTLTETALFLISQPIGFVVLAQKMGDRSATRALVDALLRPLLAVGLPISVFVVCFATDLVTVVLQRGAFTAHAVDMTSAALGSIATGLWASTTGFVLLRLINASARNRLAAVILICGYACNALVNVVLVPRLGVMGIGMGEAARGIFLLVTTACALHCGGMLLRRVLGMALPAAGFVIIALIIRAMVATPLMRLMLACPCFALGTALCMLWFTPGLYRRLVVQLQSVASWGATVTRPRAAGSK